MKGLVRIKTPLLQYWQFDKRTAAPEWALSALTINDDGDLVLDRRSGRQVVNFMDCLIRNLDEVDLIHCTDAEFKRDYEVITDDQNHSDR
jgi:hypothetical protein